MPKKAKKPKRQKLIKELDHEFSKFIRLRDCDKSGYVKCPLCGAVIPYKKSQNMHFIPRGVLKYRWDEKNCYAGCMRCNVILNGNYIAYTLFMINKYGKEKVEEMKNDKAPFEIKTWEIAEKIIYYRKMNEEIARTKYRMNYID